MTTLASDFHCLMRIADQNVILTRGQKVGRVMHDAINIVVETEAFFVWNGCVPGFDPILARPECVIAMSFLEVAQTRHGDTRAALTSRRIAEAVHRGA